MGKTKQMNLTEIYVKEVILKEIWKELEGELQLDEVLDAGLSKLLGEADKIVFEKFGIDPSQPGKYFIAGSARLYLFPELREVFNLKGTLGDLDIVIPDKNLWIKAGLKDELAKGGIYRPTTDGSIEVFTDWDPSKAGGEYADTKVRSTPEIMRSSNKVEGYYYMSLVDVIDYKVKLGRDKEQEVVTLVQQYMDGKITDRKEFLRQVIQTIGKENAKKFLGE